MLSSASFKITAPSLDGVFGSPAVAINGDTGLQAFLRSLAIKYGEWSPESAKTSATLTLHRVQSLLRHPDLSIWTTDAKVDIVEVREARRETINLGSAALEVLEVKAPEGWETFDTPPHPINAYLSQFAKSRVFINRSTQQIKAFVETRADSYYIRAFMSCLWYLMPWYFHDDDDIPEIFTILAPDSGVKDDERNAALIKFCDNIANEIDIRSMILHGIFDGVADRARKRQIQSDESLLSSVAGDISSYNDYLAEKYAEYEQITTRLNALRAVKDASDETFFNFFNTHKNISVISMNDDNLRFGVEGTLEYYDEDEFNDVVDNDGSFIHDWDDATVRYLSKMFGEHRGLIKVKALFDLGNLKLIRALSASRSRSEDWQFTDNAMPNPHIYFYGCSGANDKYYAEYAKTGDWELAVEQAIQATKNISWGDTTVCGRMINYICEHHKDKFIYMNEDGSPNPDPATAKMVSWDEFKKKMDEIGE